MCFNSMDGYKPFTEMRSLFCLIIIIIKMLIILQELGSAKAILTGNNVKYFG